MKPHQILTFLISVFLVLWILALVFPEKGFRLGHRFSLQFAHPDDFFTTDTTPYADISGILMNSNAAGAPPMDPLYRPGTVRHSRHPGPSDPRHIRATQPGRLPTAWRKSPG